MSSSKRKIEKTVELIAWEMADHCEYGPEPETIEDMTDRLWSAVARWGWRILERAGRMYGVDVYAV